MGFRSLPKSQFKLKDKVHFEMSVRLQNQKNIGELDNVFKALSHRTRRQILMTLKHMGGKMSAGEIASRYSCAWPTITKHLKVLQQAGLVEVCREGNHQLYKLNLQPMSNVEKNWISFLFE